MKQLRERLLTYGSQTLLTEELLALVLRTGSHSAQDYEWERNLLEKYGGLGRLMQVDYRELAREAGLGEARIALLKAVLELGRRLGSAQSGEKYAVKAPADAANLVISKFHFCL